MSKELENPDFVDQKSAEVHRLLASHAVVLSRQGSVHQSWRYYRGRRLGPFYRLIYRQGGRQWSVYLGRDEGLANEVRQALRKLQAPLQHRALDRQLALVKAMQKKQKQALDAELHRRGLYRKGNEIRGWRHLTGKAGTPAVSNNGARSAPKTIGTAGAS